MKYFRRKERGRVKLLKNIDDRFAEIGFIKVDENKHGAFYKRETEHGYTQRLDLGYKESGIHLIHSYEQGCNTDGFNNSVGITMYEAKLCRKKMKRMGWKERKDNALVGKKNGPYRR